MSRLRILLLGSALLSAVFSLLNISFRADFSALAFPLAALFSVALGWYVCIPVLKNADVSKLPVIRKLLQYYPFVLLASFVFRRAGENATAHFFDLISVILWVSASVFSLVALYFLNPKRVFAQNPVFAASLSSSPPRKKTGALRVFFEILDWIDAFIQAAFTVALINIFILQLYAIPSESMVPEFLVGDRVISFKTASGPVFPLSDVSLPRLRSYNRGDIVIFKNPHYTDDRKAQIRTFVSQLVYMLTFTSVNINVDENGELKADPLVKRVVGVPGEQLVMVDGVLYNRTQDNTEFLPVAEDANWACWNLNVLSSDLKERILQIPLDTVMYDVMTAVEKERSALDVVQAAQEAQKLAARFAAIKKNMRADKTLLASDLERFVSPRELYTYVLFSENSTITRRLIALDGGTQWFTAFMCDWTKKIPSALDPYADSMYRLNIMIKLTAGRMIVRNAELILSGSSAREQMTDPDLNLLKSRAASLEAYVTLNDSRNMPVFPEQQNGKPSFLKADEYFAMGDNRFNSLDLRHSFTRKIIPVTKYDPYSASYASNLAPQPLAVKNILGTTLVRFWPLYRIGIPGNTVKLSPAAP